MGVVTQFLFSAVLGRNYHQLWKNAWMEHHNWGPKLTYNKFNIYGLNIVKANSIRVKSAERKLSTAWSMISILKQVYSALLSTFCTVYFFPSAKTIRRVTWHCSMRIVNKHSPNSKRESTMLCAVKSCFKTGLHISLSRDQSCRDSQISFDKNWLPHTSN
jgi:hypothetical protein